MPTGIIHLSHRRMTAAGTFIRCRTLLSRSPCPWRDQQDAFISRDISQRELPRVLASRSLPQIHDELQTFWNVPENLARCFHASREIFSGQPRPRAGVSANKVKE